MPYLFNRRSTLSAICSDSRISASATISCASCWVISVSSIPATWLSLWSLEASMPSSIPSLSAKPSSGKWFAPSSSANVCKISFSSASDLPSPEVVAFGLKYTSYFCIWLMPAETILPSPTEEPPPFKILYWLWSDAINCSNLSSSTDDIENKSTKKQSSRFIKSLNVAIHAGAPCGASSFFCLAIFIHRLHRQDRRLILHGQSEPGRISAFLQ